MRNNLLVILITYNNQSIIRKCLESISKQSHQDYKLIIVDNNSNDKTLNEIDKYLIDIPKLKKKTNIIKNDVNIGFSKAVNIGLKAALGTTSYRAVLLVNPDTYFDEYLFKNGVGTLFANKEIGACCPLILNPNDTIWWVGTKLLTMKEIIFSLDYNISSHINQGEINTFEKGIYEAGLLTGCIMFLKIEAIKKTGRFDENYFMYVEDLDYSLRLIRNGYKTLLFNLGKVIHIQKIRKESIRTEIKRNILCINSTWTYLSGKYPKYVLTVWIIKIPAVIIKKMFGKLISSFFRSVKTIN